jgi:hypothetical protein
MGTGALDPASRFVGLSDLERDDKRNVKGDKKNNWTSGCKGTAAARSGAEERLEKGCSPRE